MTSVEIRVLGPTGIEDHHAHLLRIDPSQRVLPLAAHTDDRGIDGHCLRLMGSQAVLIGAYAEGVLRAGLEIIPDRTARKADAVFTAESAFSTPAIARMLLVRLFDEVRRYRLGVVTLYGFDDAELLDRMADMNAMIVEPSTPLRLHFLPSTSQPAGTGDMQALAHGHA